jgi:hypothetical protein
MQSEIRRKCRTKLGKEEWDNVCCFSSRVIFLGSNDEGNVDTAERRQTRTTDDFWKRKRSWQRNQQQMF